MSMYFVSFFCFSYKDYFNIHVHLALHLNRFVSHNLIKRETQYMLKICLEYALKNTPINNNKKKAKFNTRTHK